VAAFAFVLSLDGSPLDLSPSIREVVFSTLRERSPGTVREEGSGTWWAAHSGPLGELHFEEGYLLLCDGIPESSTGKGGSALFHELRRLSTNTGADGKEQVTRHLAESVQGSFAACFFDERTREVDLVRDRTGSKPLFHAEQNRLLFVASECKMLQALGVKVAIAPDAFREALTYRWITGERCLLAPAVRVPDASLVSIRPDSPPAVERYWRFNVENEPLDEGSLDRYKLEIEQALRASIAALKPGSPKVGLLLSGGVDSSILAALAKQELGACTAFTGRIAGFQNEEMERARAVAAHVGIDIQVVDIEEDQFVQDLPYIVRRLELLPRHLNNLVLLQLIRRAGQEVDILLQGDAADTLFGLGTTRNLRSFRKKKRLLRGVPRGLLRMVAGVLEYLPSDRAFDLARVLAWEEDHFIRYRNPVRYTPKARRILGITHLDESVWTTGDWHPERSFSAARRIHILSTGIEGSLLRHDRLSQPEGIESVAPFLSPGVMEIASRIPLKLCENTPSKPVLRALSDKLLPPEVARQTKIGFDTPQKEWLSGVLFPFSQSAQSALPSTGLLPSRFINSTLGINVQDEEAVFTGISLFLLLREFGLLQARP